MTTATLTSLIRPELRVVAHTHWDREWYLPAGPFRQRLVALIDRLLDATNGTLPFLLDGQAVILEDYLDVRPERASELSLALRNQQLEAGPWYVLPDELIPGAEALIRNLLAGRRVLSALRATPPAVLYCPDSFGHPAELPTLALGFGCPLVIVWRGYGGKRWPPGDAVRWRAGDGSSVLVYHLPPDGYEAAANLAADPELAQPRWAMFEEQIVARSTLGVALLPNGADHHAPQDGLPEAIDALSQVSGATVLRSTLGGFAARLEDAAAARGLPVIQGELRDSYGYAWTLGGTLASRAQQKRRNAIAERLLTRDTEPWAALARLRDGKTRRHLVASAWKSVLLAHPHDTLCGCAIDEVARAMDTRLDAAISEAKSIREESLDVLLGHDAVEARAQRSEWHSVVVVRNRSAYRRAGVAELKVDVALEDVPVGHGARTAMPVPGRSAISLGTPAVPVQVLGRTRTFVREESPRHYPLNRLVERRRVLAWVDAVPAFGLRLLPIRDGLRRPRPPSVVHSTDREMDNGRLSLFFGDGLTLASSDGITLPDFLGFEAEGERGDLYTHSPIPGTLVRASLLRRRVTVRGPLRAEILTQWALDIPARTLHSATGTERTFPPTRMLLRAALQLDAAAPFLRLLINAENRAGAIRLRVRFRTGVTDPAVFADAAFGPIERRALVVAGEDARMERVTTTAPLHRYVTVTDATHGCTIFGDGLAECEAERDGSIAVTLLRGVGELSRGDLPERPGFAGWPAETPAAQSLGAFRAGFAVMPHGPRRDALVSHIERVADDALLPLRGSTWRTAVAPPDFVEGAQLVGRGLACSAIKESEDGEWIVLRCVNFLDEAVAGAWRLPTVREASLARLDETPLGAIPVRNGVVSFEAQPRAVVTILVR